MTARERRETNRKAQSRRFGITPDERVAVLRSQGGKCYICQKATGSVKALAMDHDHALETALLAAGAVAQEARRMSLRGALCGPCNQFVGRLGDDPEAFERAGFYLRNRPAQQVLVTFTPLSEVGETPTPDQLRGGTVLLEVEPLETWRPVRTHESGPDQSQQPLGLGLPHGNGCCGGRCEMSDGV